MHRCQTERARLQSCQLVIAAVPSRKSVSYCGDSPAEFVGEKSGSVLGRVIINMGKIRRRTLIAARGLHFRPLSKLLIRARSFFLFDVILKLQLFNCENFLFVNASKFTLYTTLIGTVNFRQKTAFEQGNNFFQTHNPNLL